MAENLLSERLSIVATVDPDSYSTQTVYTDAFDMKMWRKVIVIAQTGTFATAASVVGTMYASATSTGAWTTLTDKTFTMTEVLLDTNSQAVINLSSEEVASTALRWARLGTVLSGATSVDFAAVVLGSRGRYTEAFTTIAFGDLATVSEIDA
jgi:hypothetical protein